jgi:polysaccharide biosynthesis/export protein
MKTTEQMDNGMGDTSAQLQAGGHRTARRRPGPVVALICCWLALGAGVRGAADPSDGVAGKAMLGSHGVIADEVTNQVSERVDNASGSKEAKSAVTTVETLDDKYRLAIGDRLSFRIREDEEDPKTLIVTDSGELEVPYIGRFPADGKTCKQLARELKIALEKDYYYQASVIIAVDSMTKSRGKVYLVGPVRAPGPLDIPSDDILTLGKAIMRAGGFNDYADKRNVKVVRKSGPNDSDTKTIVVDAAQILEKGKTERDLPLEPGDLVLIPERLIRF